jgi:hypothetical protein
MVDAIFTWVDGNDAALNKVRAYYQKKEDAGKLRPQATSTTRFADNNELYYSIHLLRKNASWINRIFLVTDNQRPAWLSEAKAEKLDVTLVDHREIFQGFEYCLPTFNSSSIEFMLCRIQSLSKEALYFNDDIFTLREIAYGDFFADHKLRLRGQWRIRLPWIVQRLTKKQGFPKAMKGLVDIFGGMEDLPFKHSFFSRAHAPFPLLPDKVREIHFDTDFIQKNATFKFRANNQKNLIDHFYHAAFAHRQAEVGPKDWEYLKPDEFSDRYVKAKLEKIKKDRKIKTLTIQSLDSASEKKQQEIDHFLSRALYVGLS